MISIRYVTGSIPRLAPGLLSLQPGSRHVSHISPLRLRVSVRALSRRPRHYPGQLVSGGAAIALGGPCALRGALPRSQRHDGLHLLPGGSVSSSAGARAQRAARAPPHLSRRRRPPNRRGGLCHPPPPPGPLRLLADLPPQDRK